MASCGAGHLPIECRRNNGPGVKRTDCRQWTPTHALRTRVHRARPRHVRRSQVSGPLTVPHLRRCRSNPALCPRATRDRRAGYNVRRHDRNVSASDLHGCVARADALIRAIGLSTSSPMPTTQSAFFTTPGTWAPGVRERLGTGASCRDRHPRARRQRQFDTLDSHHIQASTFGFTTLIGAPAQYAAI